MQKIAHYLIMFLLGVMFLFLLVTLLKPDIILPVIEWIKSQIEYLGSWNYFLSFLAALLESLPLVGIIIPGQLIMMSVGGFYGGLGVTQFVGVLSTAIIGSVISNACGYYLGKHYGEVFFDTYGMWVGIEKTELKYLKKGVNTWGPWSIILSKFHPQARAFLPFIAGSMGFHGAKFWISNIIASTLWASVFICVGIFFAEYYEAIVKYIGYIMLGIFGGILGYFWIFKKEKLIEYWREKNKDMEEKYNK